LVARLSCEIYCKDMDGYSCYQNLINYIMRIVRIGYFLAFAIAECLKLFSVVSETEGKGTFSIGISDVLNPKSMGEFT
jgi:hypothetical protein